ncbi:MAG: S8 family serine peptidase, partial [Planctomycetes bacterium]|nr:S8 family serine peptidase [Planctomycetota bacterium]
AMMKDMPQIEYVEPHYIAYIDDVDAQSGSVRLRSDRDTPNDPYFSDEYSHYYHLEIIEAANAWDISHGNSSVVIAIVDNGVDWDHEDLFDNLWVNEAELNGTPGVDDDDNGYMDDIHGYDFYDDDSDPTPGNLGSDDHGTHCAGIACAVTNNGSGIASISWNCSVMAIRAGSNRSITNGYDGIYYAAHNGADVISNSWSGYSASRFNREIIEDALAQGAIIIAAAGNDNNSDLNFPAAYENVIAVANTNSNDVKAFSSNYGQWIDISAPGQSIWSTLKNDTYGYKSGTSMSAPLVAGLCGLVKSYHLDWDNHQVATQVIMSTDNIDDQNPSYAGLLGTGRINAYQALTESFDAIILTDSEIIESGGGDGDGEIDPNESVQIFLTMRSLFSSVSNVSVTLSIADDYVTLTNDFAVYGDIEEGLPVINDIPFELTAHNDLPYGHVLNFSLEISGDGYSSQETFLCLVPPIIGDHNSGNFVFTITSEGELGHWQATSTYAQGVGFVYPADSEIDNLFSSSFAAGTDPDYVVDAYFNDGQPGTNDWLVSDALYFDSTNEVPQIGRTIFSDGNHPAARGLQVTLVSWTFAEDPDDDYIILNYELLNSGTESIDNLYTGIFADWDIGESSQDDEGAVDDVNQIVWMRGNDYDIFAGMAAADPYVTANLSLIDNEVYVYND